MDSKEGVWERRREKKIMVGALCLFESHNYKVRVIGDN